VEVAVSADEAVAGAVGGAAELRARHRPPRPHRPELACEVLEAVHPAAGAGDTDELGGGEVVLCPAGTDR